MTPKDIQTTIGYLWLAFFIIWLLSAFFSKPAVRVQSISSRIMQSAVVLAGCLFIFDSRVRAGWFATRFVPATQLVAEIGFAATIAGLLIAVWARFFLGKNWSARVTVKQDHQLIRRGPYRFVRHPIYSGISLALLGSATIFGEWGCLWGVVLAVAGFRLKSLTEESFMREQFGADYTRYQHEVKALVPFVW